MIENEFKAMLNREQFDKIMNELMCKYQIEKSILQVNYYYDTEDFSLARQNASLRVRQKEKGLVLEYKHKNAIVGSVRKSEEKKSEIAILPKKIVLSQYFSAINNKEENIYVGNLITERINFNIDGAIISLDKNYYLGNCDYELEIEAHTIEQINNEKNNLQINFTANRVGKYKRFYNALSAW